MRKSRKHYFPPPPPPQQPPVNHRNNHQPHYSNYENTLIQEVLYLHSLWRNGPPFKKPKPPSSDKPWPIPVPVSTSGSDPTSTWPAFPTLNKPITRPATLDERARLLGIKTQLNAIESCLNQFKHGDGDGDEDEDEEDDGDDEDEREFFEDLFTVDKELRGFYKGNCDGGEFFCLVCGVIGKNNKKKYMNCVALVQHCKTVSNTRKRKSHRAFGSVVCKVLGWDVNRLPSINDLKSELKNHADEDPTIANMETSTILTKLTQTEKETIPSALVTDNIALTDVGFPTVDNMETSVGLAKPTQSKRETIPSALEMDNVASTNVGCPTFSNMETSVVLAEPTQTERETIPSALETDNVATLANANAGCIAIVPTYVESEVKNHADEDPTVANMETSTVLTKLIQTEKETIPSAPVTDNIALTDVGFPTVDNMETSVVVLAEPTQTERETIPSALETDNVATLANANAACIPIVLTHVESEVENRADEDPTIAKMETNIVLVEPTQTEGETIPAALEKDNVTSTNAVCIATEVTQVEGVVKTENNEGNIAVKVIGDASLSQVEPEGTLKNNGASTDIGAVTSAPTCIESEGFKVDNHDSEKDIVCSNSEKIVSPQQNNPELDMQKPSLASENDPYEQLPCLPGVFQILE